ncbi:MAG: molybdate ABC transporter substrate-binding protein [Anaerolineales bacterium]|nr:molybdate ABC transporter substrate-binding protein [Anaerolineales bacterium]
MKFPRCIAILLILALMITGCSTPTPATVVTEAPAEAVAATEIVEEPTSAPDSNEAPAEEKDPITLTVFAAASLTESFTELGAQFEAANPHIKVVLSFAGSQQVAQQLIENAPADVFASANMKYMDAVIESGRVSPDSYQIFARNGLVVIYPKDNPGGMRTLSDLANSDLKLVLAAAEVPVGQYTENFLDKAVENPAYGPTFKDDVLKNVVSYEDNVKSVATKVSLGEADAGIVYLTDITAPVAEKVDSISIPEEVNVIATYPIAPVADSAYPEEAQMFVDFVLSAEGQATLASFNFLPAPDKSSSASGGSFTVTDALEREITFEKVPQKIVLAGKALFMVADAIYLFPEAGQNIAALGPTKQGSGNFIPMIDPTFADKISLESEAGAEEIAAAQPDCVIMKSSNAEKLGTPLEELGIPVVYLDFETPDQYQRDLKTLGQLFQNPKRAEELAAYYQEKADAISTTVSSLSDDQKLRTLILYYSDKDGEVAFNVPPMSWIQTILVETAGGLPVWQDANPSKGWTKVNLEQIAAWNPDVILIVSYFNPADEVIAKLKEDAQWQALDAMKSDKVYAFAKDVYSWDQPDTRWILGLTWTASTLYPDLFPGLDISELAKAFYQDLYGMDETSFQENIQPLIQE